LLHDKSSIHTIYWLLNSSTSATRGTDCCMTVCEWKWTGDIYWQWTHNELGTHTNEPPEYQWTTTHCLHIQFQ